MRTVIQVAALAALIGLAAAPAAFAQAPAAAVANRPHALVEYPAKGGAKLTVTSPAFKDGGDIAFEYTQYRGNTFPGLAWTKGPAGTKSYAVIMQDVDGHTRTDGLPYLHWVMYNVPAGVTKLEQGMAPTGQPAGAAYGPNYRGKAQPYLGPRTPPGPKHHYHLQVFALDTTVPVDPDITYDGLTAAMKGHILASGEVVGLAEADPSAPPRPPRPPSK